MLYREDCNGNQFMVDFNCHHRLEVFKNLIVIKAEVKSESYFAKTTILLRSVPF